MATATATATGTAYKVEELLALRDSVSESAVSLEKFGDEDAIKEHVLRPSASSNTIGARKENASPPSLGANRATGQSANDVRNVSLTFKRPSPTGSYKRKKVEKLLKEHSSPPTLRVTAGGRVVPNDVPPLGSPRYSQNYPARLNAPKAASPPRTSQGAIVKNAQGAPAVFDGHHQQFVNGQGIPSVNFNVLPQPFMQPPVSIPMVPLQSVPIYGQPVLPFAYQQPPMMAPMQALDAAYPHVSSNALQTPGLEGVDVAAQIRYLEAEYQKKDHEHKELQRQEVLQASHLDSAARDNIVRRKRSYVTHLDTIRKNIKALKEAQAKMAVGIVGPNVNGQPQTEQPLFAPLPPRADAMPQASMSASVFSHTADAGAPSMPNVSGMSSFPDGLGGYSQNAPGFQFQDVAASFPPMTATGGFNPANGGSFRSFQSTGTLSRSPRARSHAIEIKAPNGSAKPEPGLRSSLDPTSPTYEPRKSLTPDVDSPGIFVPPSPSPVASPHPNKALLEKQPWLFSHHAQASAPKPVEASSSHKPSISSASTTDFFPNNAYEHSARKSTEDQTSGDQRQPSSSTYPTGEASAANGHPVTPEKGYGGTSWDKEDSPENQEDFNRTAPPVSPFDTTSPSYANEVKAEFERPGQPVRPELLHFGMSAQTVASSTRSVAGSVTTPRAEIGQFDHGPSQNGILDFADKSSSFLEGFSAGLAGRPIADNSDTELLSGYIAGIQKVRATGQALEQPVNRRLQSRQASLVKANGPLHYQADAARPQVHTVPDLRQPVPFVPTSTVTLGLNIHSMPISRSPTPGGVSIDRFFPGVADPVQPTVSVTDFKPMMIRQQSAASVHLEQVAVSGNQQANNTSKASKTFPCMPFPKAYSGNQVQAQGSSKNNHSLTRHYQGKKVYGQHHDGNSHPATSPTDHGPVGRPVQYDGAMDDLAEMVLPVRLSPRHENPSTSVSTGSPRKSPKKRQQNSPAKSPEPLVKVTDSPTKSAVSDTDKKMKKENGNGEEMADVDPAKLSRAEKKSWRENWKKRFQDIKSKEREEIEQYRRENPLDN